MKLVACFSLQTPQTPGNLRDHVRPSPITNVFMKNKKAFFPPASIFDSSFFPCAAVDWSTALRTLSNDNFCTDKTQLTQVCTH